MTTRIPVGKPASVTYVDTRPSWGHPFDVVPAQKAFAIGDADDPAVLAFVRRYIGKPKTRREAAARILQAVANGVDYVKDPEHQQWVIAPRHVVAWGWGDCKKMSTLIASIAYGLGIPVRFAVIAQKDPINPNHVWAELETEDGWTAVDPVPRPLQLGLHIDGTIETWQPFQRRTTTMQIAIRNRRTLRIPVGLAGCGKCSSCALHGLAADAPAVDASTLDALRSAATSGDAAAAVDTLKDVVKKSGKDWEKIGVQIAETACAAGLAATGYGAVAAPLCKLIGPIWAQIKKWITVKINPQKDFRDAAAAAVPGSTAPDAWKRFMVVWFDKGKDRLDARKAQLQAQGLPVAFEWNRSYGKSYQWGGGKGTYYGAVWDRSAAPQALKDTWTRTDAKFARLAMLPEAQMRQEYQAMISAGGGGASAPYWPATIASRDTLAQFRTDAGKLGVEIPTTYAPDSIIGKAPPESPFFPARDLLDMATTSPSTSSATDVRLPVASTTPPAAGARAPAPPGLPAGSRPVTPPRSAPRAPAAPSPRAPTSARAVTPPLPPGSRVVSSPAAARPAAAAAAPAGGGLAIPPGLSVEEASIIAAVRQRFGVDVARRAAAAAEAYRRGVAGLGAAVAIVRLVDQETEDKIRPQLGSTAVLLAKKDSTGRVVGDLATRAAQVNYGLSHLGEGDMTRARVAERLMAYKRAAGDATPDSRINDAVRAALASNGGFPIGAVPTLAAIAAKLPAGPGAPAPTAAEAAASAAGMPAGSRQVSPEPGPATTTPPSGGAAPLGPGDGTTPPGIPPGSRVVADAPHHDSVWPWLVGLYILSEAA